MPTRHPSPWTASSAVVQPLVLLVEDEVEKARSLASTLATHGIRTLTAGVRAGALTRALQYGPDLVLLDLSSPSVAGPELTARLRECTSAPIVVLLDSMREHEKASILDQGANDYMLEPFVPGDLLARIQVWLRQSARAPAGGMPPARTVRIRIDFERRAAIVGGREVHLTPIECKLLLTLSRSRGKASSEEQMLAVLWGRGPSRLKYLRTQIRQLRQKIEQDPARPRHLLADVGGGYRLKL